MTEQARDRTRTCQASSTEPRCLTGTSPRTAAADWARDQQTRSACLRYANCGVRKQARARTTGGKVSWSIDRNLARVQDPTGAFRLLALDHGLSWGDFSGSLDIPAILGRLQAGSVTGVVVRPGRVIKCIPSSASYGLILQTFGRSKNIEQYPKLSLISVEDAIAAYAPDVIAVELDPNCEAAAANLLNCSDHIAKAHRWGLPVLVMATPDIGYDPVEGICRSLVAATELGADVIKIGLPRASDIGEADAERISQVVARSAPAVLAGGDVSLDASQKIEAAHKMRFSGFCVGRSVFESSDPDGRLNEFSSIMSARRHCA